MSRNERCPWTLSVALLLVVQLLPAAAVNAQSPSTAGSPAGPIAISGPGLAVPSPAAGNARVHVVQLAMTPPYYSPQLLTIEAGDVVKWVNAAKSDAHTACERNGTFTSVDIPAGGEWCFRFDHPGTYAYVCRMHPWMRGSVTVVRRALPVERAVAPRAVRRAAAAQPSAVTSGATVWTADAGANRIVRVADRWTTSYTIPTPHSRPRALAVSAEGEVWFAQAEGRLGCIRGEDLEEFDLGGARIDVASMVFDAAGNLWLVPERGEAGRIDAATIRDARAFAGPLTPQPCPVPDGTGARPPKTR